MLSQQTISRTDEACKVSIWALAAALSQH